MDDDVRNKTLQQQYVIQLLHCELCNHHRIDQFLSIEAKERLFCVILIGL